MVGRPRGEIDNRLAVRALPRAVHKLLADDEVGGEIDVQEVRWWVGQADWCGAAGVSRVKTLSDFRDHSFGQNYGVAIKDGPLAGINARAVFVVGKDGTVKHVEYVKEITSEPNYEAALAAAKEAAGA